MSFDIKETEKVSIKDIADMAGVSVATVSRIINENGRYSAQTEDRVRKIMEDCNYQPNLVARGLRTKKVDAIGIIIPDITNEFFAKISLELQMGLFQSGYASIICNTNEDRYIENQYIKMLNAQQVSGVIYISGNYEEEMELLSIPSVYIDRKPKGEKAKMQSVIIESDNKQGGYLATKCLIESNAKQIACISLASKVSTHEDRVNGCEMALKEFGLPYAKEYFATVSKTTMTQACQAVDSLLEKKSKIDGIFCTSDEIAAGVMKYLEAKRVKVPLEMRIVGYDDTTLSQSTRIPITTIRQPIEEMGRLGVENILAMIAKEKIVRKEYMLPVTLIERKTT